MGSKGKGGRASRPADIEPPGQSYSWKMAWAYLSLLPAVPLLFTWMVLGHVLTLARWLVLLPFRLLLPGSLVDRISSALSAAHERIFDEDRLFARSATAFSEPFARLRQRIIALVAGSGVAYAATALVWAVASWWIALPCYALGAIAAGRIVGDMAAVHKRLRNRPRYEREPDLYATTPTRLLVLTADLTAPGASLSLALANRVVDALPAAAAAVDYDVALADAPAALHARILRDADLVVVQPADRWTSTAALVESIGPAVADLEARCRNPLREYVLLLDVERLPDGSSPRMQARVAGRWIALRWACEGELEPLRAYGLDHRVLKDLGIALGANATGLGECIDALPEPCAELFHAGIVAASPVESANHLIDLWDVYSRLLAGCRLAATEDAARLLASRRDIVKHPLSFVVEPDPPEPVRAIHQWLSTPVWTADDLEVVPLLQRAFSMVVSPSPSDRRFSPLELMDLARMVRNKVRHGPLSEVLGEALRVPLIRDFLRLHANQTTAFALVGEGARFTFQPAGGDAIILSIDATLRRQDGRQEILVDVDRKGQSVFAAIGGGRPVPDIERSALSMPTEPRDAEDDPTGALIAEADRLSVIDPERACLLYERAATVLEDSDIDGMYFSVRLRTTIWRLQTAADPVSAVAGLQSIAALQEQWRDDEPDSDDRVTDLAYSYDSIGKALVAAAARPAGDDLSRRLGTPEAWLRKGLELRERVLASDPGNPGRMHAVASSYGELARLAGTSPTSARDALQRAAAILEDLVASHPDKLLYLRDLNITCNQLGAIEEKGGSERARERYERAVATAERLVALSPSAMHMRDLRISCSNLDRCHARDNDERAEVYLERAVTIAEQLVDLDPDHAGHLRELLLTSERMAAALEQRDPAGALDWHEKTVSIRERAAASTPDDPEQLLALLAAYQRTGLKLQGRRPDKAREFHSKQVDLGERLVELAPDLRHLRALRDAAHELGRRDELSAPELARRSYVKALKAAERLAVRASDDDDDMFERMLVLNRLAVLTERDDPAAATEYLLKSLAIGERLAKAPDDVRGMMCLSLVLEKLMVTDPARRPEWATREEEVRARLKGTATDQRATTGDDPAPATGVDAGAAEEPAPAPLPSGPAVTHELLRQGPVIVHVDARHDGVEVPEPLRHRFDLRFELTDGSGVDDDQLIGELVFGDEPRRCVFPWRAVFALVGQDGLGMVWWDDVPSELKGRYTGATPAPGAEEPGGDALPSKAIAVASLLREGPVTVRVDARRPGVRVPSLVSDHRALELELHHGGYPPIPDLVLGREQVSATLAFFRLSFPCVIPWTAVFAVSGTVGPGVVWWADVPAEIAREWGY